MIDQWLIQVLNNRIADYNHLLAALTVLMLNANPRFQFQVDHVQQLVTLYLIKTMDQSQILENQKLVTWQKN